MKINWFPGHMSKALNEIKSTLKTVDIILYILDSRAPISCLNPSLSELAKGKKILYIFTKIDLADEKKVKSISAKFKTQDSDFCIIEASKSGTSKIVKSKINALCDEKLEKYKARGVKASIRAMVVGVPNCGKSTIVNNLCGKAKAITGDKAGVTKGMQWLYIGDNIELCDTPGTLYPNLADTVKAERLAFIGSIRDEVVEQTALARSLLVALKQQYPQEVEKRYSGAITLEEIAQKKGCLISKGELDLERAARGVIDDFRKGRIGKITLD